MQPQQPLVPPPEQPPVPETPVAPAPPPVPAAPQPANYESIPPVQSNYEFIMSPGNQAKKPSKLTGNSTISRLIVALIGVIVLIILFAVVKGLLSGGQPIDAPAITGVVQDQQEILHLLTNAQVVPNVQSILTTGNQNFIVTGQLSVKDEQTQLLTYLKTNGHAVLPKEINLKVSLSTDKELTAAITASTYQQVFSQVLQSKLATYQDDLSNAYANTKALNGRALLKTDYKSAELLLKQLNSTLG